MRVLLQKVVLHFPQVLDSHLVGQFNLVESIVDQLLFAVLVPWTGKLMLIEDAELHGCSDQPKRAWLAVSTTVPSSSRVTVPRLSISSIRSAPSGRPSTASSISLMKHCKFSWRRRRREFSNARSHSLSIMEVPSYLRPYSPTQVRSRICLLYTSDAADEEDSVDLGGRR